jgi:hypothetical protein
MSSSAIARIRAAKASPAAMFAWTLPSKLTRSPVTATGRPTRVAPARAPGTAVVGGVVVRDPIGQRSGQRRHLRQVLVPGGDHDGAGAEGTVVGVQGVPVAGWCQPLDPHTGADGTVGGELLQSPDDLRGGCVGVMGLVAEQPVHPAGGVQPEGVPPLGAPALTGPAPTTTVQHHLARHAGRCLPVVVAGRRGASAVLASRHSPLAGTDAAREEHGEHRGLGPGALTALGRKASPVPPARSSRRPYSMGAPTWKETLAFSCQQLIWAQRAGRLTRHGEGRHGRRGGVRPGGDRSGRPIPRRPIRAGGPGTGRSPP